METEDQNFKKKGKLVISIGVIRSLVAALISLASLCLVKTNV